METEEKTPFYKQIWFLGGLATLAIFALCFLAINMVGSPDDDDTPEVEMEVIATLQTNEPLIKIAREQGWIDADATEMTSVDAAAVDSIGTVFSGCNLKSFKESLMVISSLVFEIVWNLFLYRWLILVLGVVVSLHTNEVNLADELAFTSDWELEGGIFDAKTLLKGV